MLAYLTYVLIGMENRSYSVFSRHFKQGLLKYLQFPTHNYLFFILGIVQRQYLTIAYDLILVPRATNFFSKNCCQPPDCPLGAIFCTAQVLLLCLKICFTPLPNYSEIDCIVLPIRKKSRLVLKWYFSLCF